MSKQVLGWIGFVTAVIGLFVGLGYLLVWDATNDAKDRRVQCTEIAELAKAEYHREKDYTCTMLINGKLRDVEL